MMLIIATLLSITVPAMAASISAKTNSSSVKLYKSASTSSKSVTVSKGTKVTITGISGDWAKISYKGRTGYCQVKYLNTTTRYARYVNQNTYCYSSPSTSSSRVSVSKNTKLYVVGVSGSYYRVQDASGSTTAYIKKSCLSKNKVAVSKKETLKSKVVKMSWFNGGSSVLKKGSYAYIYDIDTGIKLRIKRMGGSNHADVEPATKADTAKLLKIAGGSFSWDSHAVILICGDKYIACAINTMPHGDQTITSNGYDGQFCLHMSGSLTHCSGVENVNHQSSIDRAYNWAH